MGIKIQLKKYLRLVKNLVLDVRYSGEFLGGTKKTRYGELGACDTANTDYGAVSYIFKEKINIGDSDVLVDVGCGKGRVINWWISCGFKNKIIGIELDEDIALKTKLRFKKYKNVEIIAGNIIEKFPKNGTIFYLFNPFNAEVMEKFKDCLIKNVEKKNNLRIVYYNCSHLSVFKSDPKWHIDEFQANEVNNFHSFACIKFINN